MSKAKGTDVALLTLDILLALSVRIDTLMGMIRDGREPTPEDHAALEAESAALRSRLEVAIAKKKATGRAASSTAAKP